MKRNIVIATIAAAALVGGGTATALAVTGDDGAPSPRSDGRAASEVRDDDVPDGEDGRDDDAGEVKSPRTTAADALTAALRHTPGTAVSAELDDEDDEDDGDNRADVLTWDIGILDSAGDWHSVHVDPGTGKVLSSHTEHDDDADDAARVRAALKSGSTSAAEAAKAVAAQGTVTSIDLDEDAGSPVWEAETRARSGTEHDWLVDLGTARVTPDRSSDDD
ncbi:PepSY domain-containing protein [Streptomyces sp. NPDC127072]|uniref:PepSY domain-containing protein n=1 Tax=Streptomyces sp. NPDC127072 TaxID=3347129 RepID=UPI003669CE7E